MQRLFLFAWFLLVAACDAPVNENAAVSAATTRISDLQGSGARSPLQDETVTVRGIVSGDFQDDDADANSNLGGFYLQSLTPDDDPRTSEGVFVFDRNSDGPNVSVSDVVVVSGKVIERFGETQLEARAVKIVGHGEVTAQELRLPAAKVARNSDGAVIADLEHLEGMLVRLPQTLYVQDLGGLERYGVLLLSTATRQHQFTSTSRPARDGYRAHRERVAKHVLMVDDGRAEQNVSPVRYTDGNGLQGTAPRLTDGVESLQGVLRYSRGSGPNGSETWRLMPTQPPRFIARNPRPGRPPIEAELIVASVNLLNYFSTIDNGKARCGPQRDQGCRGADSADELQRQRLRTAAAINGSGADIVGLMELENNARESMDDLLTALRANGDRWQAIATGTIGADVIRVGLIYRPDKAMPVGDPAILTGSEDPRFNDRRNRPALAQTFRARDSGGVFTVAVNHLKSKGSACDDEGDPNRNDGQGNCSGVRTAAAEALAEWLAGDPTGSGDPDILIIGDLNAYMNEDPVIALEEAGYANVLRKHAGETAWSIVFRGESGTLDHALATDSLASQVTDVAEWHINSDEAPLYDYNLDFGRDPSLFDASAPWRASDHDPLLIGLSLQPD